jgi:GNAT superfamily N-acetyltransferase
VIVRRAEPRDLPDFDRMGRAFVAYTPMGDYVEYDHEGFTAFITAGSRRDDMVFLVAEHDGSVIGCAAAVAFPFFCAPGHVVAQEMFWWVDPEKRGGMAAIRLLHALEDWAREVGANSVNMIHLHNESQDRIKKMFTRCNYSPLEYTYTKRL